MKEQYFNQRINCNVTKCKYHDKLHEKCTLGSITVNNNHETNTICKNYEEKLSKEG